MNVPTTPYKTAVTPDGTGQYAFTNQAWPIMGAGPANEGYMLIQAGIPTLCGFGPSGGSVHAPDEWVNIDSLTTTVAIYANIVRDYLGYGG